MSRWRIPTLVALCLTGPASGCELARPVAASGDGVCNEPLSQAPLPAELKETSGIATSRDHPGVFWTHNDSGGDPVVFAVDSAGTVLGRVRLRDATNRDWEDIAVGPCEPGGGSCLFVADIGDNSERHDRIAFYRVPEPEPDDTASAPVTVIRARYPDGPRDAEALFVTAQGIHVVNKGRSDAIELFRLPPPYATGQTSLLQRVQRVAPPPASVSAQVTAAAADANGERVVIRTYSGLRFFTVDGDTLAPWGRAADVVVPGQMQGEGVAWVDDLRLILTSEAQAQQPPSLAFLRCDPDRPLPDSVDSGGSIPADSAPDRSAPADSAPGDAPISPSDPT